MNQLINISDVRKYRQLGKQINADSFAGHVLTIQENELTELLGDAFSYDMFNFLENGFTDVNETYEYVSSNTFKVLDADKTNLLNYSLKINDNIFVIITSAVFDSTDTLITVSGYELSATINSVSYSEETKYILLLNGTTYTKNNNLVKFKGLRPLLVWNLLISLLIDGSLKQSDIGNFQILGDNFQKSNQADIKIAKSEYLQNATRENNKIIDYLSNNTNIYTLYQNNESQRNISDFDFFII